MLLKGKRCVSASGTTKNPRLLSSLNTLEEPLPQAGGFQVFIHWLAGLCSVLGIILLDPASKVRVLSGPEQAGFVVVTSFRERVPPSSRSSNTISPWLFLTI